ncbi:hypothetical protein [Catenovulum maritimum]|uniref:Uncharacterized protein n=1 Tax=Catenovulum maritimum TaxID=1513271 RepID=A0A0J8JQR4_9ALTE|nr:hypothetical protein [Catenovulum maritimum]KMT67061.1 hypothetical protein XM47_00240 [Catenovulum maritimum]
MPYPEKLSPKLQQKLTENTFGISFPSRSGCQMRFVRNGKDLGGFYSYKQWGSVNKAVEAAISKNRQLKALYPISKTNRKRKPKPDASCGFNGVGFREKLDKRRNKIERFYWASFKRNGKPAIKTFSLGYKEFSADQQLHAYRTAIQFRKEWELLDSEMKEEKYKDWQNKRLY